jgi:hypothetical protein
MLAVMSLVLGENCFGYWGWRCFDQYWVRVKGPRMDDAPGYIRSEVASTFIVISLV